MVAVGLCVGHQLKHGSVKSHVLSTVASSTDVKVHWSTKTAWSQRFSIPCPVQLKSHIGRNSVRREIVELLMPTTFVGKTARRWTCSHSRILKRICYSLVPRKHFPCSTCATTRNSSFEDMCRQGQSSMPTTWFSTSKTPRVIRMWLLIFASYIKQVCSTILHCRSFKRWVCTRRS